MLKVLTPLNTVRAACGTVRRPVVGDFACLQEEDRSWADLEDAQGVLWKGERFLQTPQGPVLDDFTPLRAGPQTK